MRNRSFHFSILLIIFCLVFCWSCREDETIVQPKPTDIEVDHNDSEEYAGMYVLCEGNMGSNKCTLDFLDFESGTYFRNIYPERNPEVVMELGDVGNDIKIYGSKMWMVINCSNKVEVVDAKSARHIDQVDIPNCRFVTFDGDYAYVSSYVGTSLSKYNVLGSVYKVDTLSLKVVGKVDVGYQPEELAVCGGKLYVANSGGYRGTVLGEYDNRVSVIDLSTFTVERTIDVGTNLLRLRVDHYGRLWVTSRGEYESNIPSKGYVLDDAGSGMHVVKTFDVPMSDLAMRGDSLFFYGNTLDDEGKSTDFNYGIINLKTLEMVTTDFIPADERSKIKTPYGIVVTPLSGDVYIMDATNYTSSGRLYRFDKNGKFKTVVDTGDIPGHAVLLKK